MPSSLLSCLAKTARRMVPALTIGLMALPASAYVINNETPYPAWFVVFEGNNAVSSFLVQANSSLDCASGDPCNPHPQFDFEYTLGIHISQQHGDFETYIPLFVGGTVNVRTSARPWTDQAEIHAQSLKNDGTLYDETYANFGEYGAATRDVQFLASADCQFFEYNCCNAQGVVTPLPTCSAPWNQQCPDAAEWNTNAHRTHLQFRYDLDNNQFLRGIILAGDLTQGSRLESEWEWYLDSWEQGGLTLLPYVFDGLGNHDFYSGHNTIRSHIRDHGRNTVRTRRGLGDSPHYSWDWHDVHFVQLNLFPSDTPSSETPDFQPYGALNYLYHDLVSQVGSTGRPVVLVHHYGLNEMAWWDANLKVEYWDVIAPYNVIAIIHGHTHLDTQHDIDHRVEDWYRPAGASGGPSSFTTINVSAARYAAYCELRMGPNNAIEVQLKNGETGDLIKSNPCIGFNGSVYVSPGALGAGDGGKRYPWTSVQDGVDAVMTYDAQCLSGVTLIRISAGTYAESVTANISRRVRLESIGGLVRIGEP